MNNKEECEIVQDLLFGYVDGVLNYESKKLIEKHLIGCEKCQEELKQIQADTKEKGVKEKIELDYLKKVRRKARIKSIFMATGIMILILFIIFLNSFIKVKNITDKAKKTLQSNNYCKTTVERMLDNQTLVIKEYYKDGKSKLVWEIYTDDGVETAMIQYAALNSDELVTIYEKEKKAIIEKGSIPEIKNKTNSLENFSLYSKIDNLFKEIQATFLYSIELNSYRNGKECYVVKEKNKKNNNWELWIDKETGLPVKEINRESTKTFYAGTNIVKDVNDDIKEYSYEFNTVIDEDVTVPDLSNYIVDKTKSNYENLPEKN